MLRIASTIRSTVPRVPAATLSHAIRRCVLNGTEKPTPGYVDVSQMSPEERKAEAAKVAMELFKDMGRIFLSSQPEDETQPIDTSPIWEDPTLFESLSLLHQGQVLQELQEKYDKSWKKLTKADKQLGYYIAYGDWGCREEFHNWRSNEAPYDLPFTVPSKLQTTLPNPSTVIRALPPVILAETEIRKPQFNTKRIDGPSKFFIYVILFVCMVAFYRDKEIGEAGKPVEQVVNDPYEEQRERARISAEEQQRKEEEKKTRKWYYLWLK